MEPEKNELVIAKCTKIKPYGAFFELVDYPGAEGFSHISDLASGWVKNIHSVVRTGQIYVAKVTAINRDRNEITLSLRSVTPQMKERRLKEWRREKRARALIKVIADKIGISSEEAEKKIIEPILNEYETLYKGLEAISITKEVDFEVPEEWKKIILDIVERNIEIPKKTIRAEITLQSYENEGLDTVKQILKSIDAQIKKYDHKIYTIGAPRYMLEITAQDYKTLEALLSQIQDNVKKLLKKHKKTEFELKRIKE